MPRHDSKHATRARAVHGVLLAGALCLGDPSPAHADAYISDSGAIHVITPIRAGDVRFDQPPGFAAILVSSVGTARQVRYLPLADVSQIDTRDTGFDDSETVLTWRTQAAAPGLPQAIVLRIPKRFHAPEDVLEAVRAARNR